MSTKKQLEVLDYVKKFKKDEGTYPTLHQIAEAIGVKSVSTVHAHITKLVEEDKLIKVSGYSGYELPLRDNQDEYVPLIGYITAGFPIEAIENDTDISIKMSQRPKSGKFYALKVRGDSMVDEGIFDGDTVIIKKQDYADNGQTVVAVIDENQATLKKIYKEKKGYRLQPANQTFMPIYRDEVEIRGIVWEVQRSFDNTNNKKKTKKYKTLDLFAGVGGIRKGFENAGFITVFANDFEKNCKITYDLNYNDAKLVVEDITKIEANELPEFDFLLGGFPCQAFSIAGYRKGFEDERGRGNLFFDIARIIEARKPEGFLLENVKNLKSHDNGNTFKVIQETLEDLGYHLKHMVLNSMDYGNIPQNRERIYIVGFKDKERIERFEFPKPIKLTKTIKDILDKKVDEKYYYNGKPLFDRIKDDVTEQGKVYQWRRQYVRENKKGVSPTLTANMGMGGHNVPIIFDGIGIRKLTPRECFRLQGFDNDYRLPENLADSALYKQAGNSVTVTVVERVAKQMQNAI